MASVYATFKDPLSDKTKQVKVGASWTLFFLAGFIIPIFYRKFYKTAIAVIILQLASLFFFSSMMSVVYYSDAISYTEGLSYSDIQFVVAFYFVLIIFVQMGVTYLSMMLMALGNKWTARRYYKAGWKIIDADDPLKVKKVKMVFSLPDDVFYEGN